MAMRAQIKDLTAQLAESCLYDRRQRRTPPQQVEEEDEDDDGYGSTNPFAEHRTQGCRPPAQVHANRWENGFKLDIPEFSRCMQPEEFLDWVAAVEKILDFKEVLEDRRVSLVTTKFQSRAAAWWQQLKQARVWRGKLKITSWEKLVSKMQPFFFPHNYLLTMYQRLQNWSQGSKFVDEYMEGFYKLLELVDLSELDEQLVLWYIGGLRPQIQDTLNLLDLSTVLEAY